MPDISITSISYDASSQSINITTDNRVQEVGDISCLFKIYEYNLTHPDASQVEADFPGSHSIVKSLSLTTETDNGDGTFQYAIPYSNIAVPNVSAPEYCGYDKKVKVMIDRNSPTVSVADSNFSNIIDVSLLCPVSLSILPSIPISGYTEMETSKTSVFGQYSIKFAYYSSGTGSGYISGLQNSTEDFKLFREISQGGVIVEAKTEVASASIYSLSETDHPFEGTSRSWFSQTDTIDVSSLSIDINSNVSITYYIDIGISVAEDSGYKQYWNTADTRSRTFTDSLSSIALINDLSCHQCSDTQVSLDWTCDGSAFDEVVVSGGSIRFDLYERISRTALEIDRDDDYLFMDHKDLGWRKVNSIPFTSEMNTTPFSYDYTVVNHKQHYYVNFAILIVIIGDLSYLSHTEPDLSSIKTARTFIKSNNARNFKTVKEKAGILDSYARKSLEFDKCTEHVPYSTTRKKAIVRGSGMSYKTTR